VAENLQLLLIDPQNDFCDLPESACPRDPERGTLVRPQLPVSGAHADMERSAALIRKLGARLTGITVTLDSHQRIDIAHPGFWRSAHGGPVAPFTEIRTEQLESGAFVPHDPALRERALTYLRALDAGGRYTLMVWPVHCELGSFGHNVHAAVRNAYNAWEDATGRSVRRVLKGENPLTEHYSALMAEVPDPGDPRTALQAGLVAELDRASLLLVAGEASSHCVRATVSDLVAHLPSRDYAKLVLVTDCMSPVAGFEAAQDAFFEAMRARGVRLVKSADVPTLIDLAA
jgi:nicotinamidase/pyrazinamidase